MSAPAPENKHKIGFWKSAGIFSASTVAAGIAIHTGLDVAHSFSSEVTQNLSVLGGITVGDLALSIARGKRSVFTFPLLAASTGVGVAAFTGHENLITEAGWGGGIGTLAIQTIAEVRGSRRQPKSKTPAGH